MDMTVGPLDPNNATTPANAAKLRNEIVSIYQSVGLQKTSTYGSKEAYNEQDVYTSTDLICTIESGNNQNTTITPSFGVIDAYKPVSETLKPMADAIPGLNQETVLSSPKITNSSYEGYQKAEVGQSDIAGLGGATALLFKKGTGAWQYFVSTQQILLCNQYNTPELVAAFKGDKCVDDNNQESSVK